ncbi:hypothetical protein AB1Y20_009453 [Prymnesium parvum]|uniref:Protein xylosyltransferase n=1 Tax=Prymnesium parvum TaxID=97485 RepID=A0AB34K4I9_PRYPA
MTTTWSTPSPAVLRSYFRALYRDPRVDQLPSARLTERWSELMWIYHTTTPSLQLAVSQDFHHAHQSACGTLLGATRRPQQPGLVFCSPIKVRNLHWFGFWRPTATLPGGCDSPRAAASAVQFEADHAWVEAVRIATKVVTGPASVVRKFGEGGGHGCWFLRARGSGVYVNTGRSLRIRNRSELLGFLGYPQSVRRRTFYVEMDASVEVCTKVRRLGYNSVQIIDDYCGESNLRAMIDQSNAKLSLRHACYLEIVSCHHSCTRLPTRSLFEACVNVPLRTGWDASLPCRCNESNTLINCRMTDPSIPPVSHTLTSTSTLMDYSPWPSESIPFRAAVQAGCRVQSRFMLPMRRYLSTVYPASRFDNPAVVSEQLVLKQFHSLHWWYTYNFAGLGNLLAYVAPDVQLVTRPAFECTGTKMHSQLLQKYTATPEHYPFLPCKPGPDCLAKSATFVSEFASHRFFEVWHFALKSKRELSAAETLRWSHVLDGDRSMWYWHAPGSGIFYDGQAVCAAPNKMRMLVSQLKRWARKPFWMRTRAAAVVAHVARLQQRMGATSIWAMVHRLNLTAHGIAPCSHIGLDGCMYDWFLMDRWDVFLADLGRANGCDTLFFTASMWGIHQAIPMAELADLRLEPEASRLRRATAAERQITLLRLASSRLSLRDPLELMGRNDGALPCYFMQAAPTLRLACPGHVSWAARDVPRYERNCRRVDSHAGLHDSAFMK